MPSVIDELQELVNEMILMTEVVSVSRIYKDKLLNRLQDMSRLITLIDKHLEVDKHE